MVGILGKAAAAMAVAMTLAGPSVQPAITVEPKVETRADRVKRDDPKPKRKGPPEGYVRKTLPNPGWRRLTGGNRGRLICRTKAANPVPMTRQVARRITIDAGWPSHSFRHYLA